MHLPTSILAHRHPSVALMLSSTVNDHPFHSWQHLRLALEFKGFRSWPPSKGATTLGLVLCNDALLRAHNAIVFEFGIRPQFQHPLTARVIIY